MTLTAMTAQHGPVATAPRRSRTANHAAQAPQTQSSAPSPTLNSHCALPSSPVGRRARRTAPRMWPRPAAGAGRAPAALVGSRLTNRSSGRRARARATRRTPPRASTSPRRPRRGPPGPRSGRRPSSRRPAPPTRWRPRARATRTALDGPAQRQRRGTDRDASPRSWSVARRRAPSRRCRAHRRAAPATSPGPGATPPGCASVGRQHRTTRSRGARRGAAGRASRRRPAPRPRRGHGRR